MYKHNGYSGYNMFITLWTHFEGYSEWLLKVLFEVERRVKLSPYPDQVRIFGYMSERLINVYCIRHNLKVKYVPVTMSIEDVFVNPSNWVYTLREWESTMNFRLLQ